MILCGGRYRWSPALLAIASQLALPWLLNFRYINLFIPLFRNAQNRFKRDKEMTTQQVVTALIVILPAAYAAIMTLDFASMLWAKWVKASLATEDQDEGAIAQGALAKPIAEVPAPALSEVDTELNQMVSLMFTEDMQVQPEVKIASLSWVKLVDDVEEEVAEEISIVELAKARVSASLEQAKAQATDDAGVTLKQLKAEANKQSVKITGTMQKQDIVAALMASAA